jgi:hypothetical protein
MNSKYGIMKVVYKSINDQEITNNQTVSVNSNQDLMNLRSLSNPLKAIYIAVETCIIRQLYPENFQFHA